MEVTWGRAGGVEGTRSAFLSFRVIGRVLEVNKIYHGPSSPIRQVGVGVCLGEINGVYEL